MNLRTWGRTYNEEGVPTWVMVTTDADGYNDSVFATTVVQSIKLNLGESPFFANIGIPAQQSVMTQIFPDYYMAYIQQYYAPNFAALSLTRQPVATPTYLVTIQTQQGSIIQVPVAV